MEPIGAKLNPSPLSRVTGIAEDQSLTLLRSCRRYDIFTADCRSLRRRQKLVLGGCSLDLHRPGFGSRKLRLQRLRTISKRSDNSFGAWRKALSACRPQPSPKKKSVSS